MLYLCPEKIWQERPSNISNLYCWNTVLHQRTLQGRRSTHKSWVLFPPSSNAASHVGWKVSLFNDASSHLLTDNNKSPHYYIWYIIHQDSLSIIPLSTTQRQILQHWYKTKMNIITQNSQRCAVTCPINVLSTSIHSKQRKIQQAPQCVQSNTAISLGGASQSHICC